jgi:hypothetical protein
VGFGGGLGRDCRGLVMGRCEPKIKRAPFKCNSAVVLALVNQRVSNHLAGRTNYIVLIGNFNDPKCISA